MLYVRTKTANQEEFSSTRSPWVVGNLICGYPTLCKKISCAFLKNFSRYKSQLQKMQTPSGVAEQGYQPINSKFLFFCQCCSSLVQCFDCSLYLHHCCCLFNGTSLFFITLAFYTPALFTHLHSPAIVGTHALHSFRNKNKHKTIIYVFSSRLKSKSDTDVKFKPHIGIYFS